MGNKWLTRIRIFQDQQLPKLTKLGFVSFGSLYRAMFSRQWHRLITNGELLRY
jgi:hypothetical protein